MPPAASSAALSAFGLPRTAREGSGQTRVASIKEERNSSSSSSSDANSSAGSSGGASMTAIRPLPIDTGAKWDADESGEGKAPTLSVKELVTKTESRAQQEGVHQASMRELKFFAVAKGLMRTALSPRARAASANASTASNNNANNGSNDTGAPLTGASNNTPVTTSSTTATKVNTEVSSRTLSLPTTGFGKFRRANTSVQAPSKNATPSSPSTTAALEQRPVDSKPHIAPQFSVAQQRRSFRAGVESGGSSGSESNSRKDNDDSRDNLDTFATPPVATGASDDKPAMHETAGLDFVDDVRETLNQLVAQLDSVDPKKLYAIRLGGELRGLLGKAQDEFGAYESAFAEHAHQVGVSVALQNFSASLAQVFAIVARLQSTKALFLLNKKFKREVLFAFQEINSYYTSLFMELAMAVARRSGIVLPLPSPVKPQPPVPPVEEPSVVAVVTPELPSPVVVTATPSPPATPKEPTPARPSADVLCLEAHQLFYSQRRGRDPAKALELYTCEQAQYEVRNERKQRELYALAMLRYSHAAENGHSGAQFELDPERAMLWYKKAASSGHTAAEAALGRLLFYGELVERDLTQAIHFLQRAAAKNDASSQRLLGTVFAHGDGAKVDLERAIAYLRRAVEGGDYRAMFELARLLLTQSSSDASSPASVRFGDREETHDEALRLLLNAGAGGVADAFVAVGELFESSAFLRDKAAALRFYSKAATATPGSQRHPKAAKRAAAMHYSGIGTVADKWKAHAFYSLAADAGDAEALNALGLMFEEGEGCDLDFQRAGACYRRAVELQNPHAHFNLGCLLMHGKGVPRNIDAAQAHFQQALALGYSLARDFLKPATT
ncbi:hypothetical protein PybrP1_010654 [[Pythium] brassicae (nom. inval.)]|nr:hypothetical protein PybrP1_010654 [[Pythium] brassicae (nom. inval.)]